MIYCIPLDTATEEFYASVARAAGLPIEQVLRDTLFKLAGELALEALGRVVRHPALQGLPFVLETPNELPGYAREIALLKELHGV